MDRKIPYDEDLICDECGHKGAYDFMGDYLCEECANKICTNIEYSEDCECDSELERKCEWCGRYPVLADGDYCAECEFGPTDDDQANDASNSFDDIDDDNNVDHTDDVNE